MLLGCFALTEAMNAQCCCMNKYSKQAVLYNAVVFLLMMDCIGFPCILLLTLPQHEVLQWSILTLTQNDITSSATVLQAIGSVVFLDFTILYNASVLCEILNFSMMSYIGFPCILLQHDVLQ